MPLPETPEPRRRRRLAAALALLCVLGTVCVAALTRGPADHRDATAAPGSGTTTSSSPAPKPTLQTSSPAAPAVTTPPPRTTVAPAPSSSRPATPWRPPAPVGLSGPVADVLAQAPVTGPVRIATLVQDAQGHPDVEVTTAVNRAEAAAVVQAARALPGSLAVTVDQQVRTADLGTPVPVTAGAAAPGAPVQIAGDPAPSNDTFRSQQWALDTLHAESAWALHNGSGQTVAVIDTGVDGTHPDLAARLLPGIDELGQYPDGRTDPEGHGTHVAGIIGAIANNDEGVAGLADGVSILPVRVMAADGSGWSSDVANGIIWAADHGAGVVNLSLAGDVDDPTLASAVSYAQSKDVVVVAAAGNSRTDGNPVEYPAAYAGVVAVAATDSTNASADFSETGSYVTLAAPGVSIASTYPVSSGYSYVYMSGTSMASPYAAAAAALVRAAVPGLSATSVIDDLVTTTDDLGAPGRDAEFGAGLIDPVAAIQYAQSGVAPAAPAAPGTPTTQPGNGSVTVSWHPAVANGSPITRYTVTVAPGGATATTTGAAIVTIGGLMNGSLYTFTVTATNAVGTSPASGPSAGVRPNGPVGGAGSWFYLNDQNTGQANIVLAYGDRTDQVLVANTSGTGGDKLLIRRGNQYFVRNSLTSGVADSTFYYGDPGDTVLVGDWNGDGKDTLAVRRGNTFYIKNSLTTGPADAVISYGDPGDAVLVGDWNGDGTDTLAVRRGNRYFIKNAISSGVADTVFTYGNTDDTVLVGHWSAGQSGDSLAVRRSNTFYLKYGLTTGVADLVFGYGDPGDIVVVGDWNGDGVDTLGVRRIG